MRTYNGVESECIALDMVIHYHGGRYYLYNDMHFYSTGPSILYTSMILCENLICRLPLTEPTHVGYVYVGGIKCNIYIVTKPILKTTTKVDIVKHNG